MIWLTWRQFRVAAAATAAALVVLAVALALTGPGLASGYSAGITACTRDGDCARFFDRFFDDYQAPFQAVTVVVLILPALLGLFWGAPLVSRELEAGTHLLVWSQSITRTRWLTVKLTVVGGAAVAAAGVCSLVVTWWSTPLDRSAAPGFTLMDPLVFGARGIVPMAYAAFAFVLGVTVGMLVRRTVPAMAVTLAVFAAVQIVMPLAVRPHLLPAVSASFELGPENVDSFNKLSDQEFPQVILDAAIPGHTGAWVLSSRLTDPSGRVGGGDGAPVTVRVSTTSGPCAPSQQAQNPGRGFDGCIAEINRLGYRQRATYQPFERFWPFQWIETGIYVLLTAGLAGLCFRWIRRRLS
ncbi:ABC transporter permease [Microbispora bryophytorum]|uniref:ABC transporter permease n=1 Tax=Microbispora bryophytorum subsp. camponoti TaxID=1677852 RepID=A0ABR8L113_9ACTN|nr:ABC transporter permease [Microbispora camponoti]MBD3142138.1 ABC transporter permease [Microbispora camponoti]